MNYKLNCGPGDRFQDVAEKAKRISQNQSNDVEFEFNEITCIVNSETNLELLFKDYSNAHIMEWKSVGPACQWDYDADTQIELYTRKLARAKELKRQQEEWRKKDNEEQEAHNERVKGIAFGLLPGKEDEYAKYVSINSDNGYSSAVIDYGEAWAKVMQKEMSGTDKSVADVAEESQKGLGYLGITGFQYGCAVNALSTFWKHGEALRKWHNKKYGKSEDTEGVVNPAILVLKD